MNKMFLTVMAVFLFSIPAFSASELVGKRLVDKLIKSGRAQIIVIGEATNDPRLSLIMKYESDWKKLNKEKKESVCMYVKSIVNDVKNSPQKYTRMPSNAPFYQKAIKNIENMCLDCWEVSSEYGSFVIGDEAWERMEYKDGSKGFSNVFEKQNKNAVDTRTDKKLNAEDFLEKRAMMTLEKIKSEPYYSNVLSGMSVLNGKITIHAKQSWEDMNADAREEVVKRIYIFWINTGNIVGIEEKQDAYQIEIRSQLLGRVLATWNAISGFTIR